MLPSHENATSIIVPTTSSTAGSHILLWLVLCDQFGVTLRQWHKSLHPRCNAHAYTPPILSSHTHTPVFYGRFDDGNGVILQVVVDPHIPDAEVFVGRLMHRLLEVGVKPQHLQRYQSCIYNVLLCEIQHNLWSCQNTACYNYCTTRIMTHTLHCLPIGLQLYNDPSCKIHP